MLDPSSPFFQAVLRNWFHRRRMEEDEMIRAAYRTPENDSCIPTFRNPAVHRQLDELQTVLAGYAELERQGEAGAPAPGPEQAAALWEWAASQSALLEAEDAIGELSGQAP
jgi:hypothetical protein